MEGFLRSMDANGDGVIQESEVPEERQRMFRFMAARAGVDPADGVTIATVVEGIANRMGGPPREPNPTGQSQQGATTPTGDKPAKPVEPPLVPGFGVDRPMRTVPGFGTRLPSPSREQASGVSTKEGESGRERGHRGERSEDSGGSEANSDPEQQQSRSDAAGRRSSYRFLSPRERLPEGLPDWFLDRDSNLDGQVTMAEFATDWTDAKVNEFLRYDCNNDGVITVEEVLNPVDSTAEPVGGSKRAGPADRTEPAEPAEHAEHDKSNSSEESAGSGAPKPWWLQ